MSNRSNVPDFTVTRARVSSFLQGELVIDWETESAGYGQTTLYLDEDRLVCDDECMGREFVGEVLRKLLDGVRFHSDQLGGTT